MVLSSLACEQVDNAVRASGKDPRLRRMEHDAHRPQSVCRCMASQDFHWYDQRIGHEVRVDTAVVYVHRRVIRGRGEEG